MSTPLPDLMETISGIWVALTPPDRPQLPYHHLDKRELPDWGTRNRGHQWLTPDRGVPAAITADRTKQLTEWTITARYYATDRGRGYFDHARSVANELNQLCRAVESAGSGAWPSGISEIFVEGVTTADEAEGAVCDITITVLCEDA